MPKVAEPRYVAYKNVPLRESGETGVRWAPSVMRTAQRAKD